MSIYFSVISPDDNDRIIICRIDKIVAGPWDLGCRTGKQPVSLPDVFPLQVKDPGVRIKWLLQAPSGPVSLKQLLTIHAIHTESIKEVLV
jgi:hypothetical protein